MGKKKHSLNKALGFMAGRAASAALKTITGAVLDGWYGSVELSGGKELTVKSLSAEHPYFAISVDKKRGGQDKIVIATMIFTLLAVLVNYCFLKTLSKRSERNNCNFQK
jgi:hypothetical protein